MTEDGVLVGGPLLGNGRALNRDQGAIKTKLEQGIFEHIYKLSLTVGRLICRWPQRRLCRL